MIPLWLATLFVIVYLICYVIYHWHEDAATKSRVRHGPIVHRTGGLADTVELWNPATGRGTGFVFDHHDATGLQWAIEAALAAYRDRPAWQRLMDNGMAQDFSWDAQVKLYEELYRRLATLKGR